MIFELSLHYFGLFCQEKILRKAFLTKIYAIESMLINA